MSYFNFANQNWPLVSVIILNFNGLRFIERCLNSVLNTDYPMFEVLFVDNGSNDGSVEFVNRKYGQNPKVVVLPLNFSYGFAQGNNIGAKNSHGKYLVFLNVDTEVDPLWLKEAINVLEKDPKIGAAQSKLLLMDTIPKRFDSAGSNIDVLGFTHVIGWNMLDKGQYDRIYEIFYAKGSALIMKRSIFEEVGLFDPETFLGRDDVDLCWRIWLRGYRVVFIPTSVVYHYGGGIRKNERIEVLSIFHFVKNHLTLLVKNYEFGSLLKYFPLLLLGYIFLCVRFLLTAKSVFAMAILNAFVWNIKDLSKTLAKRHFVNRSLRHESDRQLVSKMLPLSYVVHTFFAKKGRINLT